MAMPRPRRGPALCDDCERPALIAWIWRGRIVCPGCLLHLVSDAIRASEPIAAEPLELAQHRERDRRRRVSVAEAQAEVVRINGRRG